MHTQSYEEFSERLRIDDIIYLSTHELWVL